MCYKRATFPCCFLQQYCSDKCQVKAILDGHKKYCNRQQDLDKIIATICDMNPNYKFKVPALQEIYKQPVFNTSWI